MNEKLVYKYQEGKYSGYRYSGRMVTEDWTSELEIRSTIATENETLNRKKEFCVIE